jgi:ABC-type multidrug transport system ATPase subunit
MQQGGRVVRPPVKTSGGFTQFNALFRKTAVLQRRARWQVCCQCCSPVFIMFMLASLSAVARTLTKDTIADNRNPQPTLGVVNRVRALVGGSTLPYAYTEPAVNPVLAGKAIANISSAGIYQQLGSNLMWSLPPRSQYPTKSAVDDYMYDHTTSVPSVASGYLISQMDANTMTYSVYWNNTYTSFFFNAWDMADLPGPIFALDRSAAQLFASLRGMTGLSFQVNFQELPSKEVTTSLDFVQYILPLMMFWAISLLFPIILQSVVYEEEKGLLASMVMQGVRRGPYYFTHSFFYGLFYLIMIMIMYFMGALFGLRFFVFNDASLVMTLLIVWGWFVMIPMALLSAQCFSTTRVAQITTYFGLILVGILAEVVNEQLFSGGSEPPAIALVGTSLFPPFCVLRGLYYLSMYSASGFGGLHWSNANSGGARLMDVINQLFLEGICLWVLFFFVLKWQRQGWTIRSCFKRLRGGNNASNNYVALQVKANEPDAAEQISKRARRFSRISVKPDVDRERETAGRLTSTASQMQAQQQAKQFHSTALSPEDEQALGGLVASGIRKVFKRSDGTEKVAVNGMSLCCPTGTITAMLGSSGGGKTTFCLSILGKIDKDMGSVRIAGYDLDTEKPKIFPLLGVCPQFDAQWDELTGREHLLFMGRIRGLSGKKLKQAVDQSLESVNLVEFADVRSRGYSGGMRRRLSVAMAFEGSPAFVLLDEPTTGLDPTARKQCWDAIQASRAGKAILMTTHALEEAEALADRVCIVNSGNLECIDTVEQLKRRYGNGYQLQIATADHGSIAVKQENGNSAVETWVYNQFKDSELLDSIAGTYKFAIPESAGLKLSRLFEQMEENKTALNISDWALSRVTLEQVFLIVNDPDAQKGGQSSDAVDLQMTDVA